MADTALAKAAHWSQIFNVPLSIVTLAIAALPLLRLGWRGGAPLQEVSMTSYWPLALLAVCILGSAILHVIAVTRRQGVSTASTAPSYPSPRRWKLRTTRIVVLCGVGVFLILMTWILVGMFRYKPEPVQQPVELSVPQFQGAKESKDLIEVRNRTFVNERVLLDGHSYTRCRFLNATFVYNGTAPFAFQYNVISGLPKISTDSDVVSGAWALAHVFRALDMQIVDENNEPIKEIETIPLPSPTPTATPRSEATRIF